MGVDHDPLASLTGQRGDQIPREHLVPLGAHDDAPGTAEVLDELSGKANVWTLVGSTEANLSAGRLSAESPVGQALRNKPVGSEISVTTPKGDRIFKIEKLI